MFEKLENRAIIEYSIKTKSALHIGGHQVISPADVDNPIIKDSDETPIVPGSSLKGVLRSEMERLLKGLDIRVCNSNNAKEMCPADKECPVCILFGGKELAASLRIRDATANSKRTIIRDGVAIDRKTRKAVDGGKYDVEAVPKGTEFKGSIIIENL
ncbi:MAG: RAMP superfamily CRISPR-associated protein, partial [Methanosarcinales archaeon]